MKYKCLVFDHDDTTVKSTETIHHPCFQKYLSIYHPDQTCSLEKYFCNVFHPGLIPFFKEEYGMTDEERKRESAFWLAYVEEHIPEAYEGIREIMLRHKAEGGLLCVISHSLEKNILRDYQANALPEPDVVYGWSQPEALRKPNPYPLRQIMLNFDLKPEEILMIDDLKPGLVMAKACGVDFAAAGWANDIAQIELAMRENADFYFKTVGELDRFLNT